MPRRGGVGGPGTGLVHQTPPGTSLVQLGGGGGGGRPWRREERAVVLKYVQGSATDTETAP